MKRTRARLMPIWVRRRRRVMLTMLSMMLPMMLRSVVFKKIKKFSLMRPFIWRFFWKPSKATKGGYRGWKGVLSKSKRKNLRVTIRRQVICWWHQIWRRLYCFAKSTLITSTLVKKLKKSFAAIWLFCFIFLFCNTFQVVFRCHLLTTKIKENCILFKSEPKLTEKNHTSD